MIFDTDVLIRVFRGHPGAAQLVEEQNERRISLVTYAELIQGARSRQELREIRNFLNDHAFQTLPLSENIGHRACVYMEEYTLKTALSLADALIAATAVEHHMALCTANRKHYRAIGELDLRTFRARRDD
ncbi:MAG: type II toxin-antitoxin system VapC family toxin [Candidatus Latescibacteria bacterium]|nr:type II toxin-antitoxin system VapC family toxin [Candidatus Latescibacterota bacterium]